MEIFVFTFQQLISIITIIVSFIFLFQVIDQFHITKGVFVRFHHINHRSMIFIIFLGQLHNFILFFLKHLNFLLKYHVNVS